MSELQIDDTLRCLALLPRNLAVSLSPDSCVAGGYVRAIISGDEPSDIDVFPLTDKAGQRLVNAIKADDYNVVASTENADTYIAQGRPPIQIVKKWQRNSMASVLECFDLTVASAAISLTGAGKATSLCHPNFYADLAAKRLTYTFPPESDAEPGGTMLRVMKYARRGFKISPESLADVLGALYKKTGPNAAMLRQHLREVDPLSTRVTTMVPTEGSNG